jgi:outer membrane protein TolC
LSLAQPIYNGGALRAEQRKAEAAYQAAGGVYKETVLQAFQQVADALYAIEHDAETLQARSEASAESERNLRIAAERYQAGGISQTALLEAQRLQTQSELDRTSATAARDSDSVTLLEALGGGWWNQNKESHAAAKPPHGAQ